MVAVRETPIGVLDKLLVDQLVLQQVFHWHSLCLLRTFRANILRVRVVMYKGLRLLKGHGSGRHGKCASVREPYWSCDTSDSARYFHIQSRDSMSLG